MNVLTGGRLPPRGYLLCKYAAPPSGARPKSMPARIGKADSAGAPPCETGGGPKIDSSERTRHVKAKIEQVIGQQPP